MLALKSLSDRSSGVPDGLAVARRLEPELDAAALAEAARALLRPRPRTPR